VLAVRANDPKNALGLQAIQRWGYALYALALWLVVAVAI
jgi:hypothetical protein